MSRTLYEKYSDLIEEEKAIKVPDGWETIVQEMLEAVNVYQKMEIDKDKNISTLFTKIKNNNGWLDIEYEGGVLVMMKLI